MSSLSSPTSTRWGRFQRLQQQFKGLQLGRGGDCFRRALIRFAGLQDAFDDDAEQYHKLADKVARLSNGVLKGFKEGQGSGAHEDDELVEMAEVVDKISSSLKEIQEAGLMISALDRESNNRKLEGYNKLLNDIISSAKLDVTLDIRKALRNISMSRDTPSSTPMILPADLSLVELPPNPNPTFVKGRDEQRKYVRAELLRSPADPIAVLGGGGMGKTTFAVTLLHDEAVVAKFGRNRIFVNCDSVTTADGIISDMLTLLRVTAPKGVTPRQALIAHLQSLKPRVFLVLDNLESSWDTSQQEEVETVLTNFCSISSLALMITMRGTRTPRGQRWFSFAPLEKLCLEDARSLFVDISSTRDDKLDELLGHLDGLPLAVTLMAELGKNTAGDTPSTLLRSYLKQKTSMVYGETRTSGLDISIMVSIRSRTMRECPDALEMLPVLCLLPDGLRDEDLESVFPKMKQRETAIQALRAVALAIYIDNVTRVLVPIRDFILVKYPPSGVHLVATQKHFIQLASSGKDYPDISRALVQTLSSQMINVQSVLMHALPTASDHLRLALLEAINGVGRFSYHSYIGDCTTLLRAVLSVYATHTGAVQRDDQSALHGANHISRWFPSLLQKFRRRLSRMLSDNSQRCLRNNLAHSTYVLGATLRIRHQYTEAAGLLNEAKAAYMDLKHTGRVASCLWNLASTLRLQGDYDQAISLLNEAKAAYTDLWDQQGVADCLRCLGETLQLQGDSDQATSLLNEAKAAYTDLEDQRGVADCLCNLGEILRLQDKYDQATALLNEAQAVYTYLGNRHGVALCLWSLGEIMQMQGDYDEATRLLNKAKAAFTDVGNQRGVADCLWALGDILRLGSRHGVALCLWSLGETLQMQGDYDQAISLLDEARAACTDLGDRQGVADCLGSLDNILRLQGDYKQAADDDLGMGTGQPGGARRLPVPLSPRVRVYPRVRRGYT